MATFTILARQNRSQPATSPGQSLSRGQTSFWIRLNCPTWATETGSIAILIEQSIDGGVTWRHWTNEVWQGGQPTKDGQLPAVFFNEGDFNDKRSRVTVTPSVPINFGLDGETL